MLANAAFDANRLRRLMWPTNGSEERRYSPIPYGGCSDLVSDLVVLHGGEQEAQEVISAIDEVRNHALRTKFV